jgi:hypothetical protein
VIGKNKKISYPGAEYEYSCPLLIILDDKGIGGPLGAKGSLGVVPTGASPQVILALGARLNYN